MSDFISPDFSKTISITNKKHDVTAITLLDPKEKEFKNTGFVYLEDAETGEEIWVDSNDLLFQKKFQTESNGVSNQRKKLFNSINLDSIDINTDKSYITSLISFFKQRMKRY